MVARGWREEKWEMLVEGAEILVELKDKMYKFWGANVQCVNYNSQYCIIVLLEERIQMSYQTGMMNTYTHMVPCEVREVLIIVVITVQYICMKSSHGIT